MADGSRKPIRRARVGDEVIATDPLTGQRSARKVTNVWSHTDRVIRLNVGGEWLTTTEDHPFYNQADRAWQRADEIDLGDRVATADGRGAVLRRVRLGGHRRATAHNLTVEVVHTYHVGERSLLVHNDCRDWAMKHAKKGLDAFIVFKPRGTNRHIGKRPGQKSGGEGEFNHMAILRDGKVRDELNKDWRDFDDYLNDFEFPDQIEFEVFEKAPRLR